MCNEQYVNNNKIKEHNTESTRTNCDKPISVSV